MRFHRCNFPIIYIYALIGLFQGGPEGGPEGGLEGGVPGGAAPAHPYPGI